jgi:hypothetical protein
MKTVGMDMTGQAVVILIRQRKTGPPPGVAMIPIC